MLADLIFFENITACTPLPKCVSTTISIILAIIDVLFICCTIVESIVKRVTSSLPKSEESRELRSYREGGQMIFLP